MSATNALKPRENRSKTKEKKQTQQTEFHSFSTSEPSFFEQPLSKILKLSDNIQLDSPSTLLTPKRKFQPLPADQNHSPPLDNSMSIKDKEGANNLYRPPSDTKMVMTQRERKIRQNFPDFFPTSEAENPDGP